MGSVCSEPRCHQPATVVAHTRVGDIPVCHAHAEEMAGHPLQPHDELVVRG